ncbi:MAG: tetratricopeptide repeat protein [Bellilinea sp.]
MAEADIQTITQKAWEAYQNEDYETAANAFSTAVEALTDENQTLQQAEMRNNLSVALLKAGKPQEAYQAALGSDQIFAAAGDLKRQAMALANIASALEDLKRLDEALELFTQSAALFKQISEKEMRAYVLQRISTIQLRQGKRIESLVSMDAALEEKKKLSFKDRLLRNLMGIIRRLSGMQ